SMAKARPHCFGVPTTRARSRIPGRKCESKESQTALSSRCEPSEEFGSPDGASTKRFEMRRHHLDIHPIQAALCQMIDQVQQGHVRRIGFKMKHAFTGKRSARINAVDPAGQATVTPGLHTMGMTQAVKLQIRGLHLRGDPGTSLTAARNL